MVCLQLEIGALVCFRLAPHDVNYPVTLQGAVPAEPQRRRLAVGRGQEVRRAHRALDRSQLQVSCTPLTPSHGWALLVHRGHAWSDKQRCTICCFRA